MARFGFVKIALLLAFGISHLPGYGLHAIVSVDNDEVKACCGDCVFGHGGNSDHEPSSSSEDEDPGNRCSVCRLLADVFVADIVLADVTSDAVEIESNQFSESADANRFSPTPPGRGPPALS